MNSDHYISPTTTPWAIPFPRLLHQDHHSPRPPSPPTPQTPQTLGSQPGSWDAQLRRDGLDLNLRHVERQGGINGGDWSRGWKYKVKHPGLRSRPCWAVSLETLKIVNTYYPAWARMDVYASQVCPLKRLTSIKCA